MDAHLTISTPHIIQEEANGILKVIQHNGNTHQLIAHKEISELDFVKGCSHNIEHSPKHENQKKNKGEPGKPPIAFELDSNKYCSGNYYQQQGMKHVWYSGQPLKSFRLRC